MSSGRDLTDILTEFKKGPQAAHELLEAVYPELRRIAENSMRHERSDHTLQATALVHEAYLKLVDQKRVDWQGETHFKAVAAQAMRRLLVDHARARGREKRGGQWRRVAILDAYQLTGAEALDLLALDDAMNKMRELDERQARIVELRVYGGLSNQEVAQILDVSTRTVDRDWKMGQAWLRRELGACE